MVVGVQGSKFKGFRRRLPGYGGLARIRRRFIKLPSSLYQAWGFALWATTPQVNGTGRRDTQDAVTS